MSKDPLMPDECAAICSTLNTLLPEGLEFVLIIVTPEGELSTLASMAPRASKHIVDSLSATWSPEDVDTVAVRPGRDPWRQ